MDSWGQLEKDHRLFVLPHLFVKTASVEEEMAI